MGTDRLQVAGAAPTSSFVSQVLQTMTQDVSGSAVLHLSDTHTVTLQGITAGHVNASLFS